MSLKNILPNTSIAGDLGSITLRVNIRDIAEAIVKQIAQAGFRATYQIDGDSIVFTISLQASGAR